MLHPLPRELTEGIELPTRFTNPFDYVPHPLVEVARGELCDFLAGQSQWHDEIGEGKMFGVLVVEGREGNLGFLAAFSGYLDKQTQHQYFVPPIFDLLNPAGYFAREEANISQINKALTHLEEGAEIKDLTAQLSLLEQEESQEIETLREEYRTSRERRKELRSQGCDPALLSALNAESQRQKGALKRRELHYRTLKEPLESALAQYREQRAQLIGERQERSAALQNYIFSQFRPLNALGERRDLVAIFKAYNNTTPPAGSGECAAPKLLHYALKESLRPIAMGEFWWGRSTRGEVRRHMSYYPACRGKCHPILGYMLRGIEIEAAATPASEEQLEDQLSTIYEDEYMVAFDKPSGLPSVRGLNHTTSVQSIAEERYPHLEPNNLIVHRLDMDTSGVIIVAKSAAVQRSLQEQFAHHTIRKRYIALLEGVLPKESGAIDLPLCLDPLDRPRQRVDFEHGKAAYTHYNLISLEGLRSRVALYPQSGRTHQLRVHCAHHLGLDTPIVGDRLYGHSDSRLMLHAEQITLLHPATGRKFTLRSAPGF